MITTTPRLGFDVEPLSDRQASAIRYSTGRLNILDGAIRSGKTYSSILAWLLYVRDVQLRPGDRLAMIGRTERTLTRNILDPIAALLGPSGYRARLGAGTAYIYGKEVSLYGANDARSEGKLRGATFAGVYGDEVTLWPREVYMQALGRMSPPGARLIATTNPDAPGHWLKVEHLDRARALGLRRWRFRLEDNPSLSPEYVSAIKTEYTGLWYQRFIEGQWCMAEGAVYSMWDPARHVVKHLPPLDALYWVGIDYGTAAPFAALLLGLGADQCLYLVSEYRWDSRQRLRQLTDVEYSRAVRAWLDQAPESTGIPSGARPRWVAVDPSAASFKTQLRRDRLSGVMDANNNVLDGIRATSSLLTLGRLKVHESCRGFITEIPGYRWDEKAQLQGEDRPVKDADHSLDGERYAVMAAQTVWRPWLSAPPLADAA